MTVKQVLVVRTKYPDGKGGTRKLRTGKLVAQGAHAAMAVLLHRFTRTETGWVCTPAPNELEYFRQWVDGIFRKICVGVDTEEQLLAIHTQARAAGLPCSLIQDSGLTEFDGVPTYTVVGIGPWDSVEIDKITGALPLL